MLNTYSTYKGANMKSFIKELQDLKIAMNANKSRLVISAHKVRIHCYYKKLLHEINNYIPKE